MIVPTKIFTNCTLMIPLCMLRSFSWSWYIATSWERCCHSFTFCSAPLAPDDGEWVTTNYTVVSWMHTFVHSWSGDHLLEWLMGYWYTCRKYCVVPYIIVHIPTFTLYMHRIFKFYDRVSFMQCNVDCNEGVRVRSVTCRSMRDGRLLPNDECTELRPPSQRDCSDIFSNDCFLTPIFVTGGYGPVSCIWSCLWLICRCHGLYIIPSPRQNSLGEFYPPREFATHTGAWRKVRG